MADKKISQLNEVINPSNTDFLPVVNAGLTKKVTLDNLVQQSTYSTNNIGSLTLQSNLNSTDQVPIATGAGLPRKVPGSVFATSTQLLAVSSVTATGTLSARILQNRFADFINVRDFGDLDGIGNITLNVPSDYPTIQAALAYLASKRIIPGTTVTIKVADGIYTQASVVYLNHPDGERIEIIGNETTPSNCVLQCSTFDGFYLPPGYKLGKLNGFRVVNTTTKSSSTPYLGILTDGGQYLKVGPKIEIHNFYYGIAARNGGFINAGGDLTNFVKVTDAGDVGIWAFIGSTVSCEYASVSGSNDSVNSLGSGIVAEFASSIQANYAKSFNNWLAGISVLTSSSVRAFNTNVYNNQYGYTAQGNGSIEIFGSTITNNSVYGYQALTSGKVLGWSTCTQSGNNTYDGYAFRDDLQQDETGYALTLNSGVVTIAGDGPQAGASGDAFLNLRTTTNRFAQLITFVNGVERGRLQYRDDLDLWELIANNRVLLRAYDTGRVSIGAGNPLSTATSGIGIQIPAISASPTGVVGDVLGGYAPLVFDTTNNRIWVYNTTGTPAWKWVALS